VDGRRQEDIIDECIERLLGGEPLDAVLRSHPGAGAGLRAALQPALALLQAPLATPSPAAENRAMNVMLRQVRAEADRSQPAGVFAWLGTLRARPLAFQGLAVAGAIMVFGGLGIGASAATGTTPEPVRTIFRISSDSESSVHLRGTIVSIDASALLLNTERGARTVLLSSSTVVRRGSERASVADLLAGEEVDVTASASSDGSVTARTVHAKAAPAAIATPSADASAPPAAVPSGGESPETPEGEHGGGGDDGEHGTPGAGETEGPDDGEATAEPTSDDEGGEGTPEASSTNEGDGHDGESKTPDHPDGTKTPESEETHGPEPTSDHESSSSERHTHDD